MSGNYWDGILGRRVSRRRVLAATGASAATAVFLAACGGDDGDGGTAVKGDSSGLLTKIADATKDAKKGGTLKFSVPADIPNFDAHFLSFADAQQVLLNFNRLVRVKPGILERSDGTIIGDLAESWEFSPDKMTLTMKVRKNAGMPDVPPVNGRKLDANDVVYSWERWIKNGTSRSDLANTVNPNAPILSLTATDSSTVVIRLKQPISTILSSLSNQASGQFFVFPKEAESQIDLRRNPIGAGPYYLSQYTPSSRFVYSRNPNYYGVEKLYPDVIDVPIISEYATGLAQLRAGNLYFYAVTAEDMLQTKRDVSQINLYQTDLQRLSVSQFFGFQPGDKTPFRDVRLRQAWSMCMDRDLFIATFGNVDKFEAEGLPVESAWNSAVVADAYAGWWLDPKGKDLGPGAKYYQRNLEEATKLVRAAVGTDRATVIANKIGGPEYGANYPRVVEAMEGMAQQGPFKLDIKIQNYATNWQPEFRDGKGYFDGVAFRLTPYPADPGEMLYAVYNKGGSLYYGFDKEGKGTPKGQPFTGDPTAEEITAKLRSEFEDSKRKELAKELQKYLAEQQYFITELGGAAGFQLAWPAVRNWLANRTPDFGQYWPSLWVDPTLPPNKA